MANGYKADPNSIILNLNSEYAVFEDIEVYLGCVGRITYPDNTQQFVDEHGNEYSPRLSESELAAFCMKNMQKYEQYHSDNEESNERGERVQMIGFW